MVDEVKRVSLSTTRFFITFHINFDFCIYTTTPDMTMVSHIRGKKKAQTFL